MIGKPETRKPQRYGIILGCGTTVSPRAYLRALRDAMAHPDATFKRSFTSDWISATGREIVGQWRAMCLQKMNEMLPWWEQGKGNRAARRARKVRGAE